jgi:hypothetical protein
VSGSKKPAIDGQLIILAAGDEGLFKECATAFDIMVGWLVGTLGELIQQQQQPCGVFMPANGPWTLIQQWQIFTHTCSMPLLSGQGLRSDPNQESCLVAELQYCACVSVCHVCPSPLPAAAYI